MVSDHSVCEAVREIVEVDLDGAFGVVKLEILTKRRDHGGPIGEVQGKIRITGAGEVEDVDDGVDGQNKADRGQGFLRQRSFSRHF